MKHETEWAQLKVGEQTIWLMKVSAGKAGAISRDYSRHWTPVASILVASAPSYLGLASAVIGICAPC
jgi:hypothetical protein